MEKGIKAPLGAADKGLRMPASRAKRAELCCRDNGGVMTAMAEL